MKNFFHNFVTESFYVLSLAIAIFFVLEWLWPRLVISYIDLGQLLIIWLVIAIFILVNKSAGKRFS